MDIDSYLGRLTARLGESLASLPEPVRRRHAAFLLASRHPDGGWTGREGGPDLYYTGFALRGLAVLDALTDDVAAPTAAFLRRALDGSAQVIDFFSLLYSCLLLQISAGIDVLAGAPSDWPDRVDQLLARFRSPDGGYGKAPGAASGSTYHTFLVALCYQLLQRPLPEPDPVAKFVMTRRRDDGGFVEIAPMRRSGTNPTAAAVGLLQMTGAMTEPVRRGVVDFLAGLQNPEGGLRANTVAPLADLLSTFTGAWTLAEFDSLDRIDRPQALKYVRSLERPDGGFHGGVWDGGFDVEYTFYGLGALALLHTS
jgi:geranylgeranyl transferase type-2 subunit beta